MVLPQEMSMSCKTGRIRSSFKIGNCLKKSCLSCLALPQDPKNVVYFYVRLIKVPMITFIIECRDKIGQLDMFLQEKFDLENST